MKIIFVITRSDTIGGAHIHVADLAQWLIEKGHSVRVVLGGDGIYCGHLHNKNVPYITCRYLQRSINIIKDLRAIVEIRKILKKFSPDLVSLHSSKAGLLGRVSAYHLGFPVIFTAHGWSFTEGISARSAILYRLIEKLTAPLATSIITVSEFDRLLALKAGIAYPEKLVTIHNAMPDSCRIALAGRNDLPVRIIMVARLDKQKNHAILISALAEMSQFQWTLDLVGSGPLEKILKDQVHSSGLSDRIHFLGLRDDVDSLLEKSHIFVLTSHWEGFPRSILEAMRARLPVIASNVGGVAESVKDGETGYLISRDDMATLKLRLQHLIENPNIREQMGAKARKEYEDRYYFDRMAEETFSLYLKLVSRQECVSV